MHTISGLLSADDPSDYNGSTVFSIDRQGEAVVIVTAPLHDGELPMTLLITPDMPCHQYFAGPCFRLFHLLYFQFSRFNGKSFHLIILPQIVC